MLEIAKFARKPFFVDGTQVTEENIEEVASWCNGDVRSEGTKGKYVKVRVQQPLKDRQTMAFVGDWVLYGGTGYKVYTPKAFEQSFERVSTDTQMVETRPIPRKPVEVVEVPL